ncbi:uncharacterized protein METZ01_LOCUS432410, partial [marine metagenome]
MILKIFGDLLLGWIAWRHTSPEIAMVDP